MLRRRHINADPRARILRSMLAAAWPPRQTAWAFEDYVLRPGGALLRGLADAARWPFERLAWLLERRLVWPLQERAAATGWSPPVSAAGAGALAALAAVGVAVGVLWPAGGNDSGKQAAAPTRVAIAVPEPLPQAEGPVLRGAPPSFDVGEGAGAAAAEGGDASATDFEGSGTEAEASAEASLPEALAATSSSKKPVPAGPAAMKVARRFSEAFVFYEIGERAARAKTVFGETATPQLATALGERPPRLPADAKVPKARVVNLVPGPRAGKAYTVSVSLLRVGLTSELRLELNKKNGAWMITDVRG